MLQQSNDARLSIVTTIRVITREAALHPILSAEEEYELAIKYRDHRDDQAKDKLINSHLRLVIKIARAHSGYKIEIVDLISEGTVGLMKALEKFNPELGNRFSTYAIWWIRAQIREFSMHSFSQVKIGTTAAQKKLFFNLSRLQRKFKTHQGGNISNKHIDMIAQTLGVSHRDVLSMAQRMAGHDASLQARGSEDDGSDLQEHLVDSSTNPEEAFSQSEEMKFRKDMMYRALEDLSERERTIFESRNVSEDRKTLDDLSHLFSLSRERIRQIESRALDKIRKSIRNLVIEQSLSASVMETRPS